MNHLNMNMNGINGVNGVGGGMPVMNHATNGIASRSGTDQDRDNDYEAKMNTYIYDYFLKHQQYECARALLSSELKVNYVHSKSSPGRNRDMNGVDENAMDADSKDGINSKKPEDLPNPDIVGLNPNTSFLLEWFSLFWDMFLAQRKAPQASMQAMQYVQHTQQQSRLRQEQQQRFLQQPGMIPGGMQNYQNLLRMQQGVMNPNELRQRASQNNLRNVTPQQLQMARSQQQQMQQQMLQQNMMQRDGSDGDMNGPRPRTPSSGENAPSPSKRPRLDGPPFNQQQGMPMANGRPAQGMQGPQMMAASTAQANKMLMNAGIHPSLLSQSQLESFHSQMPHVQHKSIQVYAQNMANQTRQNMPQPGMPNQGSPMMQTGLDVGAGMPELYAANGGQMRLGQMPPGPAGGNHALQDYQMQLMLLEQQNKKRLLMAKQEQENGQPMAGQPGYVPGMSPQDGRPGPSPNPSDQMKQRGTPKMVPTGLPGSPMPDGSMPQTRGSPAAMNFNQMPPDMFQTMKGMGDGMGGVGPNVNGMRPPSSHPGFNGGQFNPGMEAMARAQVQNGVRVPNNWPQGPPGQAPMMSQPPQAQQASQMGTPQQRNTTMPPPQAPPTTSATNGRPASPLQAPAPPTPGQQNKQNPKGGAKKERKDRAKPTKKGSIAAATPTADAENNPPPTPTPPTPITPQHPDSFKGGKNANGQNQGSNIQAAASISAPAAPLQPPQPDINSLQQFNVSGMDSIDPTLDMTFGLQDGGDVLEQFDFDSFLQDSEHGFDLGDASMAFGSFDPVEAATGDA